MKTCNEKILDILNSNLTPKQKAFKITNVLDNYKGSYAVRYFLETFSTYSGKKKVPFRVALSYLTHYNNDNPKEKTPIEELKCHIEWMKAFGFTFPWERKYWEKLVEKFKLFV